MGTNFYWADKPVTEDPDDPEWHVGKLSGMGFYCWGCREALQGAAACPSCGATALTHDGAKPPESGVTPAVCFTWCSEPRGVRARCRVEPGILIVDEYGKTYTGEEFLAVLAWCPVESNSLGTWFR